jgi:hypothetical protein
VYKDSFTLPAQGHISMLLYVAPPPPHHRARAPNSNTAKEISGNLTKLISVVLQNCRQLYKLTEQRKRPHKGLSYSIMIPPDVLGPSKLCILKPSWKEMVVKHFLVSDDTELEMHEMNV